jgi:hypothetical protein
MLRFSKMGRSTNDTELLVQFHERPINSVYNIDPRGWIIGKPPPGTCNYTHRWTGSATVHEQSIQSYNFPEHLWNKATINNRRSRGSWPPEQCDRGFQSHSRHTCVPALLCRCYRPTHIQAVAKKVRKSRRKILQKGSERAITPKTDTIFVILRSLHHSLVLMFNYWRYKSIFLTGKQFSFHCYNGNCKNWLMNTAHKTWGVYELN